MTTRIDFAVGAPDRLRAACQTARKRYLAGQRLIVYCSDGNRLTAFDRMLWAFDETAFVPHVLAQDALAADTPIVLTAADPGQALALAPDAWLLNLDDACPPHYEGFARVLEIVSDRAEDKAAARARWRDYLAAGHQPQSHDLSRAA
ncbi:DNA polymerase III subunit chi [Bordetella genomosp. 12]|uniref:DNA polymerase III subunit chi n=1 Tax=Bordetella genomosp. 12 TaxID=463035 RepID=A0A261VJ92_9BORD|nr:DNA polymerase III subunit chi [Bordetella genomosp. 12]OZI74145.1 DNA polymerase III subunit chi [Bordetella genomosp. 12]